MKYPLLLSILVVSFASAAPRLGYFTIGPMIHWNFSENEFKSFSYGLEAAYWNYGRDTEDNSLVKYAPDMKHPGYGLALGLENDRVGMRFSAEPQLGWVLAGVSAGPVLELPWDSGPMRFGVQGSGWVNVLAGMELRFQRLGEKNNQALGLYAKLPVLVSGARGD